MKTTTQLVLVSLAMLCASSAVAAEKLSSVEGRFQVEMPSKVTATVFVMPRPGKPKLYAHQSVSTTATYTVMYVDYSSAPLDVDANLDAVLSGHMKPYNGKEIVKRCPTKNNGHLGKAVTFSGTYQGKAVVVSLHAYVVGKRLYQVSCLMLADKQPSKAEKANFRKFFLTFKIKGQLI